jgi:hypothetical protein
VAIALSQHFRAPLWTLAAGAAVGFLADGISPVLFVRALRYLGAARTSAYFSKAPFVGAVIAVPLHSHVHDEHHRHVHAPIDAASEPHSHWHRHPPLTHSHRHYPDLHHQHPH